MDKVKNLLFAIVFFLVISSSGCWSGNLISAPPQAAFASSNQPVNPNSQTAFDPNIFVNVTEKLMPSVVNISTLSTIKSPFGGPGSQEDLFRRFFEDFFRFHGEGNGRGSGRDTDRDERAPQLPPKSGPKAVSLGTGFVIDSSGLILTNNHVVAGADEIKIQFTEDPTEKLSDGEVVGRDPELDLALIKVKTKKQLVPITLGDSDALKVGQFVVAIGNPFGHGHSVTHGIISAKGRESPGFALANYLQTDAQINPGNSGGPLVNLNGEVIGINNAIDQRAQGIGFAIPINLVQKVLPQLKTKGTVSRGYIGILVDELSPEIAEKIGLKKDLQAPMVTYVYPGQPADQAGVKPYDVILEVNGKNVKNGKDLVTVITAVPVNEKATLKINRDGEVKEIKLKVAQRPSSPETAKRESPRNGKKDKQPQRPNTGMELEEITEEIARDLNLSDKIKGVLVTNVNYDSPADKAGLIRGDVILEVNRKPVKNIEDFYAIVNSKKNYLLRVRRTGPQNREGFLVIILNLKEE